MLQGVGVRLNVVSGTFFAMVMVFIFEEYDI